MTKGQGYHFGGAKSASLKRQLEAWKEHNRKTGKMPAPPPKDAE